MRKLIAILLTLSAATLFADEGMWLFNRPPRAQLKQKYNFDPSQAWLDHLQRSSVRFNSGGSGSFISSDGLLLTNHHVGLDCLQKISTPQTDYVVSGFAAKTQADEVKCLDLEVNVLMSIDDVTKQVNAAVTPGMSAADAQRARRGVMATIEKESLDKTGLRSDVVTLFQGGEYHLYRYKKYTDLRLVFAPEVSAAFFGGDPDNFEYPRYDMDVCFFRAYENGKPVHVENYLRFSPTGVKDGDLIFVSGHPGSTHRLNTVAHLEFFRDVSYPFTLTVLRRLEVLLGTYAARSPENERRAHDFLFGVQNSRKAFIGRQAGLEDPAIMAAKREREDALRKRIAADPKMQAEYAGAWQQVDNALKVQRANMFEASALGLRSQLYGDALQIVRLTTEVTKPNGERLREYRESNLESLKQQLFSEAPIYPDLDTVLLADSIENWAETMGADNPLLKQALGGHSPQDLASELVRGTKLGDPAFRKQLVDGGKAAVDASTDPMIRFARMIDPRGREIRTIMENQVDEPLRQAYAKIANATFAVSGSETYPDATFTLRLSYGVVKGYEENGQHIASTTDFAGAYKHADEHKNQSPFDLPKRWWDRKPEVKLDTPLNFISTPDIIGGNSGSPVVNREGEFVGIIFDGNLESLPWDYQFDDRQGRSLAVDSRGILEALRHVYQDETLVKELTTK